MRLQPSDEKNQLTRNFTPNKLSPFKRVKLNGPHYNYMNQNWKGVFIKTEESEVDSIAHENRH